MQLIYANRMGTPIAVVRRITGAEAEALQRYALGESTRQSEELIYTAWRHRWWFACQCRPKGAVPPVLFVRRTYSGHYTLSQMTDRPAHAKACPFGQRVRAHGVPAGSAEVRLPPLGDVFFRWFMAAKMNVVYPYAARDMVTKQYASLRETARSLSLAPGRNLYDYSRTHPDGVASLIGHLKRAQAKTSASQRDAGSHWGVLLLVVDTIREGRIAVGDSVVELQPSQIQMPVGALDAGGPFATLLKYAPKTDDAIGVVEMFAQPVYSTRHLVPIDYAHERRTLKTLLRLQEKMVADKDVVIVIRKTLPSVQAHERGIAFQINRAGPNGKPAREVDILTIDATDLLDRLPAESQPDDIVYHLVKQDVPFHELDRRFFGIVFARLLDGVSIRSRGASTSSDSRATAGVPS